MGGGRYLFSKKDRKLVAIQRVKLLGTQRDEPLMDYPAHLLQVLGGHEELFAITQKLFVIRGGGVLLSFGRLIGVLFPFRSFLLGFLFDTRSIYSRRRTVKSHYML